MFRNRPVRALLPRRAVPTSGSFGESENFGVSPHSRVPVPATSPDSRAESSIVDSAVYRDGRRTASPATLDDALNHLPGDGSMAWIGMYRPTDAQVHEAAAQFGFHELAVEDAIVAHQRPKLERYGDTLFVVLRAARYVDESERVDFGELHVFVGPTFVLTVRHSESPDLSAVRNRMEHDPELLRRGPEAVLYAILDAVVDGYAPVVAGLQNDIDEIETEVFSGDPKVSRRIYELSREVVEFQRAAKPLLAVLSGLSAGFGKYRIDEELQKYLRDVTDHATVVVEQVDGFRQLLGNILTVNATLVSQVQNEEMRNLTRASYAQNEEIKKVSAWAAILFAPTLIGTVYGMNFDHMPELHWVGGYPFALLMMLITCCSLFAIFRRRGWL